MEQCEAAERPVLNETKGNSHGNNPQNRQSQPSYHRFTSNQFEQEINEHPFPRPWPDNWSYYRPCNQSPPLEEQVAKPQHEHHRTYKSHVKVAFHRQNRH